MKITDIRIRKTFTEGNLKAIVSLTIDDCLAMHDVKIINGAGRTFVAMPSRQGEDGVYRDIIHPIGSQLRVEFEREILNAYENYLLLDSVMKETNLSA